MRILVAIIGRMGSTRLPGKSLLALGASTPLSILAESAAKVWGNSAVYVLTSSDPSDDAIASLCASNGYNCLRGHPQYILDRLIMLSRACPDYDYILPVGTDCPLTDFEFFQYLFSYLPRLPPERQPLLYTSYFPATFPSGIEPTLISTGVLNTVDINALCDADREHFCNHLLISPNRSRVVNLRLPVDLSFANLSLDCADDYRFLSRVFSQAGDFVPHLPHFISVILNAPNLLYYFLKRSIPVSPNAFLASPGMHSSIQGRFEHELSKAFEYLRRRQFELGALALADTAKSLMSLSSCDDINQICVEVPSSYSTLIDRLSNVQRLQGHNNDL
jgi:spore coat polysaccharide biosynthesis protein SpsF